MCQLCEQSDSNKRHLTIYTRQYSWQQKGNDWVLERVENVNRFHFTRAFSEYWILNPWFTATAKKEIKFHRKINGEDVGEISKNKVRIFAIWFWLSKGHTPVSNLRFTHCKKLISIAINGMKKKIPRVNRKCVHFHLQHTEKLAPFDFSYRDSNCGKSE